MKIEENNLGTKYNCPSCKSRFYDLNKVPAVCPMCNTVYEEPKIVVKKRRRLL